jgi:hypothetical protein
MSAHNIFSQIDNTQSDRSVNQGVATAYKPLICDGNKHVDVIRTASLRIGASGSETAVTATGAELNKLAGVTSTAAELTILHGVTSTAAELNLLDGQIGAAVITVGAEADNVINVAIQLNDAAGVALARRGFVSAYLSDDANGDSIVATAPDTVAAGTDGVYIPLITGKRFDLVSEADGDIDINITKSGADTYYLVLVLGDKLTVSGAITFDATT